MKSTGVWLAALLCVSECAVAAGGTRALAATASGMASTNFAIPFGVVDSGGGPMTSASYKMLSAIGDSVAGNRGSSANAGAAGGFINQLYGTAYSCILDVDGNGHVDALTDGLLIIRALFGLTGATVTANAVGAQATRTTWDLIQPMIHNGALDIDGNGTTDALTDGLLVLRALFGLTGTAVTNGAIGAGATRADWASVRDYLNSICGTTLSQ